jgi:hypothetical protein
MKLNKSESLFAERDRAFVASRAGQSVVQFVVFKDRVRAVIGSLELVWLTLSILTSYRSGSLVTVLSESCSWRTKQSIQDSAATSVLVKVASNDGATKVDSVKRLSQRVSQKHKGRKCPIEAQSSIDGGLTSDYREVFAVVCTD